MNSTIVSIDLGSAYTKIGSRTHVNGTSTLVHDGSLADADSTYCIPSVVAKVNRKGVDHWQIGLAAAKQIRGDNVEVYEDWKAGLFDPQHARQSEETALRFFIELRHALAGKLRSDSTPVRICIPKLENSEAVGRRIVEILKEAGWSTCLLRPFLYEPESNVLGLASLGKNSVGEGAVMIRTQAMLENGPLQQAFRQVREGGYGVCVTDIGAFTTDFAYLHFDTGHETEDWTRSRVMQHSVPLGVRNLTKSIIETFDIIDPAVAQALTMMSSNERDARMKDLLRGVETRISGVSGRYMPLGSVEHLKVIHDRIENFASSIWRARREFQQASASGPHPEYITGGGSMILALSRSLENRKAADFKSQYPNNKCYTTDELLNRRKFTKATETEQAERRARELLRGGSAIGACSVFFDSVIKKHRRLVHTKYGANYV
jgi:hypothetical protein